MPSLEKQVFFLLLFSLLLLFLFGFHVESRPLPKETYQSTSRWHYFKTFTTVQKGSRAPGVREAKKYLSRYGYLTPLPTKRNTNSSAVDLYEDYFDEELEAAVIKYQKRFGLPVTGLLDSHTVALMASPRCGLTDESMLGSGKGKGAVIRYAYFPSQPRWMPTGPGPITLTYALSPLATVDYLSNDKIRRVVRRAFDRWSEVIPVVFEESDQYATADLHLGFYGGDHGDGEPFDGVLGVLAHAFSPKSGRLHFDAAERWSVDFSSEDSKVAVDLESVATHEIGHVLGLAHSSVQGAIMYPSLPPRTKKVVLTVDDVEGVQALYGSNPNFNASSLLESDTSSAKETSRSRSLALSILTGMLTAAMILCC